MGIPILGHLDIKNPPTTVANSSGTRRCTLTDNNNFKFTSLNAATTIQLDDCEKVLGQSGVIVITNASSTGSLSFSLTANFGSGASASNVLTPGGSTISFNTTANVTHMISYYVSADDAVLVNYIGMFA